MSKREFVVATGFVLGLSLTLLASPVSAQAQCNLLCTCSTSCDEVCWVGIYDFNCPECNQTTCGAWGTCIGVGGCDGDGDCPALACTSTINGTSGGDTLNGGSAHECIYGYAGDDTISGNAGDDTINGGDGNDTIYGGSGNDCLYGDGGSDNVNGDSGTDLCVAETEATCEL